MKLKVRPLKGDAFDVEVGPDDLVEVVKAKVESVRAEFPAKQQRLIHSGTILEDSSHIKDYHIKESDFVVVMLTKVAPKTAAVEQAPIAAEVPPPVQPTATGTATEATPSAPVATAPVAETAAAQRAAVPEAALSQLVDMGFPRAEAERCLSAAFGSVDRAVEYLTNGLPTDSDREHRALDVGSHTGVDANRGSSALEALRNHPRFDELAQLVSQNPAMLGQILQTLSQEQPELMQAISENQEEFLAMVQDSIDGGMDEEGEEEEVPEGMDVELTEEDNAAIDRIAGLGIPRGVALEAYLACGRNEALAANYVFEDMDNDD